MVTLKITAKSYGGKFTREGSVPSEQYKSRKLVMYGGACSVLLFCLIVVQYCSILKLQLGIVQLPCQ